MKNNKIVTVSIIGVGARGGEAYGTYINSLKDKFKIVSICDINRDRLSKYGNAFEVSEEDRFFDENTFFSKKRSELLIIATLDRLHTSMAIKALRLGYDIVLEKPISDEPEELNLLCKTAQETGKKVIVCHVLRYTVMVNKIKELLKENAIGKLISVDHTENVVFWHEAHSYVRGNWRRAEDTTPMIMAKCCHDLDLLHYFIESKCKSISSMGSLSYFKSENMPAGASERCLECKYMETCPYSAKKIYLDGWKELGCPDNAIPMNMITDAVPLTEQAIVTSLKEGGYGKCVFACDNDVVDNQTTIMQFENGVTATLKMEAFVKYGGRDIRFFGTEGELDLCENDDIITLKRYKEADKVWTISQLVDRYGGQGTGSHGGGDHRMMDKLYEIMTDPNCPVDTALENSLESHYMAIAAEKSRLKGGQLIEVADIRKL